MSTSKHIDKICIVVIAISLVLTILFMNGGTLGLKAVAREAKYESTIFDTTYVHSIDIEMDDWDTFIENCESEEYSNCTLVVDGKKYSNVAIRAKGNTSLSNVKSLGSQRYSFKLEFDHYEDSNNLDGLDKLCLNNLIQDYTMMKDYIALQMMKDFGVDTSLCSFAYITVNGEDWGLYLAVEAVEDSFLSRNYGSDSGELYKPDSVSAGGGRGNGKDFDMDEFNEQMNQTDDSTSSEDNSNNNSDNLTPQNANENTQSVPDKPGDSNTNSGNTNEKKNSTGNTEAQPMVSNSNTQGGFPGGGMNNNQGGGPQGGGQMPDMGSMPSDGNFQGGQMPDMGSMPSDGNFQGGQMPDMGSMPSDGNFQGGQMPNMNGNSSESQNSDSSDNTTSQSEQAPVDPNTSTENKDFTKNFGGGNMGGGMGSSDVKLQYIDDDPDSYSNIFDNAKTDITDSDKTRLISSLKDLSEYTNIENVVDMDEVLRYFVVHNFICNGDSYTGSMVHNYYLYEKDGQLSMIPWDYNLGYGTFQGGEATSTINTSIDSPVSGGTVDDRPMVGWIFSNEEYTEEYHELFSQFIEKWFSNGELETLISTTAEMIRPYVEKDPTKFCTIDQFDTAIDTMTSFVTLRAEAITLQLSGDNTTTVDASGLNLSNMGSMGGGMGDTNGVGDTNGGGFSMPDNMNFDFSANSAFSMITLKDADGNEVKISDIIGENNTVASIKLSDGSTVDVSSNNMESMKDIDTSKITAIIDSNGKEYDISGYSLNTSVPSMPDMGNNKFGGRNDESQQTPSTSDNENNNANNQDTTSIPSSDSQITPPNTNESTTNKTFDMNTNANTNSSSGANTWILLGISIIVLAIGIVIAIKKK